MARLILSKDGRERSIVLAAPSVLLGRAPDCTIVLEDNAASKRHCSIEKQKDSYVLRDLGSTNGTFVNDRQVIADMALRHGDEIVIGDTLVRFEDGPAVGSSLEPPAEGVVLARVKLRKRPLLPGEAPRPKSAPPSRIGDPPPTAKSPFDPARGADPARGPGAMPPTPPAGLADLLEPGAVAPAPESTTRLDALPELVPWAEPSLPPPASDRLQGFYKLTRSLLRASDPAELLAALIVGVLPLAPLDRGAVFAVDAAGVATQVRACDASGATTVTAVAGCAIEGVVACRMPAVVPGPKGADAAALPLVFQAAVRGVLWVEAAPGARLGEAELDLLGLAAAQAATFLAALAPRRSG
jgi:pSer/pThr/pTyr-binding forkhead associated (FHA) protein